jgi:hypothetical protein
VELCNCTSTRCCNSCIRSYLNFKMFTVNGSGTLTFEDASLVQINNVVNIGNINKKRLTTPIRNTDYTYWSSPCDLH